MHNPAKTLRSHWCEAQSTKTTSIHSYKSKWTLSHQIAPFMHSTTFQRIQDIRCIPLSSQEMQSTSQLSQLVWCAVQCPAPGRQLTWGHGHRFHQMWPSVPLLVSAYVSSSRSTNRYHHSRHTHFHSCYCTQDLHQNLATLQLIDIRQYTISYLIIVIFLTMTQFLENKIYTQIYTVNSQFFALNL